MLGGEALGGTSWEVQSPRQEGLDKLSHSPGMKPAGLSVTAPRWGTVVRPTGAGLSLDLTGF